MTALDLSVGTWLVACALGVFVALDAISWPQAMWSRPIVAATMGGLLCGAPTSGFVVGAWLEIVLSRHPPFGAARYPETGPASLIAGAALAAAGPLSISGLVAAVLVGWTVGWLGSHTIDALRVGNARLVADRESIGGDLRELARRHRLAMRVDGFRGAAIVGCLLVPAALFVRFGSAAEPGGLGASAGPLLAAMGLAGVAGSGARALGTRRGRWPFFAAGGVVGVFLLWIVS